MLRSIVAVVCGFVVMIVLGLGTDFLMMSIAPGAYTGNSGTQATLPLLLALTYSIVFLIAAGFVTSYIAGKAEILHSLALGVLMLAMTTLATVQMYDTAPLWWHLTMLIITLPAIIFGGYLRATRKRKFYRYST